MDRPVMRDIMLVILCLILGIIFICHGQDKIFTTGVDKATSYFVAASILQTHLTTRVVALVELVGGALLTLGLLVSTMAMIFTIEMIGVRWPMHLGNGLLTRDNGVELVMSLIGGLTMVLAFGVDRFSSDK